MKQHIAHILFAASAVLPQHLPTNWLPVTLCRFCRLSLRVGDDLLDLVFGLAIRGQPGPPASSPAAGRTWPVVRTIGRRRRPAPAGGTLPADDPRKATNLVDRE